MNSFITPVHDIAIRSDQMIIDMNIVLQQRSWEPKNQIGLRHRPNAIDQWADATGWIYDPIKKETLAKEIDFSEWNDLCPKYTRYALEELANHENISWGRVRYMKMMPKMGLSIHKDDGFRYHFVLETNKNSLFGEAVPLQDDLSRATCYHLPIANYWYKVDTSKEHFVFNGGWTPRIHLVAIPG